MFQTIPQFKCTVRMGILSCNQTYVQLCHDTHLFHDNCLCSSLFLFLLIGLFVRTILVISGLYAMLLQLLLYCFLFLCKRCVSKRVCLFLCVSARVRIRHRERDLPHGAQAARSVPVSCCLLSGCVSVSKHPWGTEGPAWGAAPPTFPQHLN